MPMLNIRAPSVPVKYLVVNQAKDSGRFKANPAKSTVHTGNRVVRKSVVLYMFHIVDLDDCATTETGAGELSLQLPTITSLSEDCIFLRPLPSSTDGSSEGLQYVPASASRYAE